jgi:hypothetical protein
MSRDSQARTRNKKKGKTEKQIPTTMSTSFPAVCGFVADFVVVVFSMWL